MPRKLDELEKKLQSLRDQNIETTETVDLLNEISDIRSHFDPPAAVMERSTQAFDMAERIGYKKGMANALLNRGESYWFMSRFDDALSTLATAKSSLAELGDAEGCVRAAMYIGSVYRSMGDLDQSFLELVESVEFFRKVGSSLWESVSLLSLGLTCVEIGDDISALEHLEKAAAVEQEPEWRWISGRALSGIGVVYSAMGRHDEALKYRTQALEVFRNISYAMGEATALNDLGTSHRALKDYDKALQFYEQSLDIRRQIQQREAQCTTLINIGELLMEQEQADRALPYLKEALSIAEDTEATPRVCQAHHTLSHAYERLGKLTDALRHQRDYVTIKEDITRKEADRKTQNLKTRLEVERAEKDAEIERLKNVELKGKNEELESLLAQLEAAQSQLVQSEKMAAIGKIVASVMHEINTPLGASSCAADVAKRCITKLADEFEKSESLEDLRANGKIRSLLETLSENQHITMDAHDRIGSILESLKSFTRTDEAGFQKVDIHEGLDSAIALLEPEFGDRITVSKDYGTLPPVACYAAELNQVFMNLLSNALESIKATGAISIRTSLDHESAVVEIEDTGVGIPREKIAHLFEPAFNKTGGRVRAGLGLVTSHNIIEKHRGSIAVDSEVGRGSTFRVTVPVRVAD